MRHIPTGVRSGAAAQVGIVAFNSSEQVAEPWPEVSVPLPDGAVFQDVWSPDLAAFEVKDGGKLYIGPLEPNSVRRLPYLRIRLHASVYTYLYVIHCNAIPSTIVLSHLPTP